MEKSRVLHIDDEQSIRVTTKRMLEDEGYAVEVAGDADEGIAKALSWLPELILLDIYMPGKDGLTALKELKQSPDTNEIPVILVTAAGREEDVLAGFEAGAVDYVTKPFREAELLARINTHVQSLKLFRMRERFLYGLSHDLRNPLTVIMGFAELMMNSKMKEVDNSEIMRRILEAGQRMLDIVNNIMDLGKLSAGQMEVKKEQVNLRSLIHDEIMLYNNTASEKKIELVSDTINIEVNIDAYLIKRVIGNLIGNSLKFTPEGGQIDIFSKNVDGKHVQITIRDNGPGIPQNSLDHLFDMYYQVGKGKAKGEGVGLGLSIVREIVSAHDGKVWVESQINEGCAFHVLLAID